jgi:hypothetical protein
MGTKFTDYVRELEAELTPDQRELLEAWRVRYADIMRSDEALAELAAIVADPAENASAAR